MPYKDSAKQIQAKQESYKRNKNKVITSGLNARRRIDTAVQLIKESKPCSDCNIWYPYYVMQFDHVRGRKNFNVTNGSRLTGLAEVLKEIHKCDLVCANCHFIRTQMRKQNALLVKRHN